MSRGFLIEPPRQKQQLVQQNGYLFFFFPSFFVLESRLIKSRFIPTANAPARDRLLQPLRKSFINLDSTSTTSRLLVALVAGFARTSVVPGWLTDTIPGSSS